MLCIQLLFPTANLLSAAEASFFLIFHGASFCPGSFLANDPFLLKIAFLKQTNKQTCNSGRYASYQFLGAQGLALCLPDENWRQLTTLSSAVENLLQAGMSVQPSEK